MKVWSGLERSGEDLLGQIVGQRVVRAGDGQAGQRKVSHLGWQPRHPQGIVEVAVSHPPQPPWLSECGGLAE